MIYELIERGLLTTMNIWRSGPKVRFPNNVLSGADSWISTIHKFSVLFLSIWIAFFASLFGALGYCDQLGNLRH